MSLLRQGKSLGDIIDLGLGAHGQRLSNAGYASNSDFVVKAYEILTGGQILDRRVAEGLAAKIEAGQTTRGELIANALESGLSLFHASRLPDVKTALLYIAAANLEASAIDLKNAMGITAVDIQAALASGGLALAATTPYFIKSSSSATDVKVSGLVDKDLMINLQSNTATLGGASGFKAMLSIDGGFDAGTVTFSTSLINGVNRLDASFATGKGLLSFTGKTGGGNYTVIAPNAGSGLLQGADGNDTLTGGIGNDKLVATAGNDTLTGGDGADTFVFGKVGAYTAGGVTHITDYGQGGDVLDFSLLLGSAAPKASSIKAVSIDTASQIPPLNGSVTLFDNNGRWFPSTPTASDIADLFGAAGLVPSKPFSNPTSSGRYVIITADLTNAAQVWLINNDSAVTTISTSEVTLIGQLDGDWNVMLNGLLPIQK